MSETRRPSDEAIPYVPRTESAAERGSADMIADMFTDLVENWQDMPEQRMQPADYPSGDSNAVQDARYQALRRNKRTVAWFSSVTSGAELALAHINDEATKQRIGSLAVSLRMSIDAKEDTTDAMVSMGDTICHLVLDALRQQGVLPPAERRAS